MSTKVFSLLMSFPFFKKSSFSTVTKLSKLDLVSRRSFLEAAKQDDLLPVSKVVIHLAWFKE
jgi:hypothetical protein